MRLVALFIIISIVVSACGASTARRGSDDVYEVSLQGTASTEGVLVLSAPQRIEVDVPVGTNALALALALRDALTQRDHEVICLIDRAEQGFSLLVRGRVEISSAKSNLGGIGGSAAQVIQRSEVIQSTAREYLRLLGENDAEGVKRFVTEKFSPIASQSLGQGIELVSVGTPSISCQAASVVIETILPGGDHQQEELQLVTNGNLTWQLDGTKLLARWTP